MHESATGSTTLAGEAVQALNTGYLDWKFRTGGEFWTGENSCIRFTTEYLHRDAGVPGTIDFPSVRAAMSDSRLAGRAQFEASSLLVKGDIFRTVVSGEQRIRSYRDFALYELEDRYNLNQFGLISVWEIPFSEELSVRINIEDRVSVLDARVAGGTDTTGQHIRHTLACGLDGGYASGNLIWSGALRLEITDGYSTRFSPALGASFVVAEGIRIFCNGGTAWKIPALDDLFWPATAFAVGNDQLRPESSWSLDCGIRYVPVDQLQVRLTGFLQHVIDMIHWQPSAGGVWRPANVGEVHARGVEGVLEWASSINAFWNLKIQMEYSLQVNRVYSADSTDGSQLPRTPHEKGSMNVSVQHRTLGMLSVSAGYTGFRYLNMANTKYLGDHLLVDTSLELRLGERWVLRANIENIFDTVAVHLREYPLPGREWSCSLEVSL